MKRYYYKLRGYLRRLYRKTFKRKMEAWDHGLWFFQEFADIYGDSINDTQYKSIYADCEELVKVLVHRCKKLDENGTEK